MIRPHTFAAAALIAAAIGTAGANAAPIAIDVTATVIGVFDDTGATAFSGLTAGATVTARFDYDALPGTPAGCDAEICEWQWSGAPYGASVAPGPVALPEVALIIENDRLWEDPDGLTLLNLLVEPDVSLGQPFDLWEVSGESPVPGGVTFAGLVVVTFDTSIQTGLDYNPLPPVATADAVALVLEESGTGGDFFALAEVTDVSVMGPPETDGDGVPDDVDNCVLHANPGQQDTDGDGYGNACDPDLNNDLIVNPIDLGMFRVVFFTSDADADFNSDGVVNPQDLGVMRAFFFSPPGPSGIAP